MLARLLHPNRRVMNTFFLSIVALLAVGFGLAENSFGAAAEEIDASANVATRRFYEQVNGAEEFVRSAKGLLIMPGVKKAAFIIGGEYGEGALRIGGKTVDYYNIVSGSIGFQIGVFNSAGHCINHISVKPSHIIRHQSCFPVYGVIKIVR